MKMWAVLLSMLYLLSIVNGQSERDIANNPYDFHLFENFEVTKIVYQQEFKLIEKLQEIRNILVQRQEKIRKYLDLAKNSHKDSNSVDHPIEAFGLVQRVTLNLTELQMDLKQLKPVRKSLSELNETIKDFPTNQDYDGALKGIVRLQIAYQLNLTALSDKGRVEYKDVHGQTVGFDCYEKLDILDYAAFADKAVRQFRYDTAVAFLREAFLLLPKTTGAHEKQHEKQLKKMRSAVIQLNNQHLTKRESIAGEDFVVLPYLINDQLKKKKKQPKFIKEESFQKLDVNLDISGDTHFMKVCRKGKLQRQKFKSKELNCRMIHHGDPYLKLGPFKEEQASEYPYAVIFHDIFSDYETNLLIRQATPHLSRKRNTHADKTDVLAKHEFKDGKKTQIVHKTVQAWMKEVEWPVLYEGDKYVKINSPTLWKLTKRIGLATNLKTTGRFSGTPMQVTNYGLGGLCAAHVDPHGYIEGVELTPSRQDLIDTGDMFGTFMAWLDDVEAGGGTAYLEPGYQGVLMPKKGAAAFWYDLSAHGHRDFSTQHGGCPVLKGSKWIMNKWIFYYDNWNKYPCHLTKNTRVNPPGTHHYF